MIEDMLKNISTIYIAYGVTDFSLHTISLCKLVESKFKLNPYKRKAFIFCNKRRTSIRVPCYDKNGFVLAQKTLLDSEKMKGVIFKYSPSRSAETAKEFLSGFKGIFVTDGYAVYNNIENITHAECWAHVRRYFYESIPLLENRKLDSTCEGYTGVTYCDKLFEIEKKIALLSVEEKQKERLKQSKPVLDSFFKWINTILNTKIVVNNKLKKALVYAQNQQKELSEFLNDGRIATTRRFV